MRIVIIDDGRSGIGCARCTVYVSVNIAVVTKTGASEVTPGVPTFAGRGQCPVRCVTGTASSQQRHIIPIDHRVGDRPIGVSLKDGQAVSSTSAGLGIVGYEVIFAHAHLYLSVIGAHGRRITCSVVAVPQHLVESVVHGTQQLPVARVAIDSILIQIDQYRVGTVDISGELKESFILHAHRAARGYRVILTT